MKMQYKTFVDTPKGLRRKDLETLVPLFVGTLLAILVCAPYFRGGWLLLLDWVIGPHTPVLSPTVYGLHGGINIGFLFDIGTQALVHIFGSSMTWLPLFLFFPLACLSVSRLVEGGLISKIVAGIFYSINPFVTQRFYVGQFAVLYAYLLLPILFKIVYIWATEQRPRMAKLSIVFTLMISIDVHYAWIGAVVVIAGAIVGFRKSKYFLYSFIRLVLILIPLNIYLVIPILGHKLAVNPADNASLLRAFQTVPDTHYGLYVNLLGLYGFWRHIPESSKNLVSGWPLLLTALLLVSAYGMWELRKTSKNLSDILGLSFILGFLLALGSQGPTGQIFSWAYINIPGFSMMREPEKFSSLLATVMSLLFGNGIARLCSKQTSKSMQRMIITTGLILEISYNPIVFWGLHGQIRTSILPSDWSKIAKITQNAKGATLVLPWQLYLSFSFTNHRIVANPGPSFLPGNIISGSNIEIANVNTTSTSRQSNYIGWIASHLQQTNSVGSLLSPLGVEYIVVYKTFATGSTSWISKQNDLTMVYQSGDSIVLRNDAFDGVVQKIAISTNNIQRQLLQNPQRSLNVYLNGSRIINHSKEIRFLKQTSTTLTFSTPIHSWIHVAMPYEPGWQLNGSKAVEDEFGTMLFNPVATGTKIVYNPWLLIEFGYFVSGATFILIMVAQRFNVPTDISSTTSKSQNV